MDIRPSIGYRRITKYVIDISELETMYKRYAPNILSQHMDFRSYVDLCIVDSEPPGYDDAVLETLFVDLVDRVPDEELIYPQVDIIELYTYTFCEDFDKKIDNTLSMYGVRCIGYKIEQWVSSRCIMIDVKESRY